jgi:GTP-binding protein
MESIRNQLLPTSITVKQLWLIKLCIKLFRDNENAGDLILDNNDLERERGITITLKKCFGSIQRNKINIIDTPGHADFEVERIEYG